MTELKVGPLPPRWCSSSANYGRAVTHFWTRHRRVVNRWINLPLQYRTGRGLLPVEAHSHLNQARIIRLTGDDAE